jgi:hypothetical protein
MMTTTQIVVSLLLGLGTFVSAGLSVFSYRQSRRRSESEIALTDTEKNQLLQDINKSRTEERIAQERWWAEQLGIVRGELNAERQEKEKLRDENNMLWREFDRVVAFIRVEHKRWDDEAADKIRELGGEIENAPQLELNGRRKGKS